MSFQRLAAILTAALTIGATVLVATPALAYGFTGPYHIVNVNSGKCLTVAGASTADEAPIIQYTCENTAPYNEDWYFHDYGDSQLFGHYVNRNSGKCLTVAGASMANEARLIQYSCDFSYPYNEEWDKGFEGQWNHLKNFNSGKCPAVAGASKAEQAPVIQYDCDGNEPYNDYWTVVKV